MSKLVLNYFYAAFKQWLQEVFNPYTYFSPIRLIPNFYDMYIMYSQSHFIKIYFIYYYYYLQSKVQNGYNFFWYMLV